MSLRRSSRLATSNTQPIQVEAVKATSGLAPSARKRKPSTTTSDEKIQKSRKRSSPPEAEVSPFKKPSAAATPVRAKATKLSKPPPLTPTPSLVKLINAPVTSYSTGDIDDVTPPPGHPLSRPRPADPHITNATLVTPGGTQATALPPLSDQQLDLSPSKQPATTSTILGKATAHLIATDSRLATVIAQHPCPIFSPAGLAETIDPFRSLVSGICGQQVSGAAAKAIKNKFVALYNTDKDETTPHIWPTPAQVAATSIEKLRTAGLSGRKAEYIQGLAEKFTSGELTTDMLLNASDEELLEKLIAVRGLGQWSVEMFACFGLKRMDILSTGDLGVQRGMAAFYGKDVAKLKAKGGGKWKYMSEKDMLEKSEPFRPYRSLFMWYMWRIEDVDVSVMTGS